MSVLLFPLAIRCPKRRVRRGSLAHTLFALWGREILPARMKQQILLVDDSDDLRSLYATVLEMEGYEVRTAIDGQAALEVCVDYSPDLLITDLSMPRMDGFALIRALKQEAGLLQLPVLLITAYQDVREKWLKPLGVDLLLEKPIDPEMLVQAVEILLRKHRVAQG